MRRMKTMAAFGLTAVLAMAAFGSAADPTPAANTGTVTGTVRGQDGKPAANAAVKLTVSGKSFRPDQQPSKSDDKAEKPAKGDKKTAKALTATTDADGKFRVENVPAGQYAVTAAITGTSRGKSNVLVKAGETADVSISMHAAK